VIDEAREVLLRALESLDQIRESHGEAKQTYLCVCWAHQIEGRTVRGWNSTDHPTFAVAGLLRELAAYIDTDEEIQDVDDDDD
jgi:HEPN domain-containing protein